MNGKLDVHFAQLIGEMERFAAKDRTTAKDRTAAKEAASLTGADREILLLALLASNRERYRAIDGDRDSLLLRE